MQQKEYKYRVYPTEEQRTFFAKCFGCCRKIWNLMLADRNQYYKDTGKSLYPQPAQYKKAYPYLKEADSLALSNVQKQQNKAIKDHIENPKAFGVPKFKAKKRCKNSYTTNNQKGTVTLVENGIKLPKVGVIRAVLHRMPEEGWTIKSATVSQKRDGSYYIFVLCEKDAEDPERLPVDESRVLGLDYKSDGLYKDSNGDLAGMPKFFRKAQKRLAKLQKKLKNKEKGSKNYEKQLRKVAKLYVHVANQRSDYLQKLSTAITKQYDYIMVEDLNMRAMANKGFGNGKATMDNGFGMFQVMLAYKLKRKGGKLVVIDKWFPSSQLCNVCGYKNKKVKNLNVHSWICPVCGTEHDRDENAAINILIEGLRILYEEMKAA